MAEAHAGSGDGALMTGLMHPVFELDHLVAMIIVHGIEIPRAVGPALYTLGFLISTSTLHIVGVLIGEVAAMQTWLGRGLRIAGGVVTASGVAFLPHALGVTVPGVR